jgi:putative flippase GtrA
VLAWHERALFLKAISFGLVGVVNTAVDFCVFWAVYRALDLPPLVPNLMTCFVRADFLGCLAENLPWWFIATNVVSWSVAVSGSYIMNSFTTFAAESGRRLSLRGYATFVASGVAGLIANTATLIVAAMFVHVLVAKVLAIAVSFLVNFSLSHFVVFRPRPREVSEAS